MLAPDREYARLAGVIEPAPTWRALSRPALTLLILGAASAAGSTGRVDAALVLSGTLCWSFVVAIQIAAAVVFIRSARPSDVDTRRALELLFLAHGPWSLWILAVAAAAMAVPSIVSLNVILAGALVPSAWTAALLVAFCRRVLNDDRRRALRRTAGHLAVTWAFILGYLAVATQLWPRILGRIVP